MPSLRQVRRCAVKRADLFDISRSEWESLIDEWIFNEQHRAILKRSLLDGRTYEQLAEEFNCSRDKIARLVPKLADKVFRKIH